MRVRKTGRWVYDQTNQIFLYVCSNRIARGHCGLKSPLDCHCHVNLLHLYTDGLCATSMTHWAPKYAQTNQIFHCPCSDRVARGHHGCKSFIEHPCHVILFTLCPDSPYVTSLIPKAHSGSKNRPKYAETNQTNPFNSMSMLKQGSRRSSLPEIFQRAFLSCQLISSVSGWPIAPQAQNASRNTP